MDKQKLLRISIVFVAFIQHEMSMRRIVLYSMACLDLPYFSSSRKRHCFRKKKKVIGHNMCVLIFSTTFVGIISHSEKK